MLACGVLVASLGLAGCNNASKTEENSASAQGSAASTESAASAPETAPETPAETQESTEEQTAEPVDEPETESPFQGIYDKEVYSLESTRDNYIEALERDYGDWPEGIEEALDMLLDDDYELMTRTINETYESGVEWLEETDGADDERQAFIDSLAEVRDQCLADVTQAIDSYRP